VVAGNFIGTDVTGTRIAHPGPDGLLGTADDLPLGNGASGVNAGSFNLIGGTAPGAGNLISGNSRGVIVGNLDCLVQGNLIGTDLTGKVALGNGTGIFSVRGGGTIGGTTPAARNLISGNLDSGIAVQSTPNLQVQGNFIGTDITGTAPLGNGMGVFLFGDGSNVGGTAAGAGNLISGNGSNIRIGNASRILGNFIGTDVTGNWAVGGGFGLVIEGSDNQIGGTAAGAGNLISGNEVGIVITSFSTQPAATRNVVQGNRIGTDAAGTSPLPNIRGVTIDENASGNTIGGTAAGEAIRSPSTGSTASASAGTTRRGPISRPATGLSATPSSPTAV
jgi:titin